jgi:uncharacterized metal-binding protein
MIGAGAVGKVPVGFANDGVGWVLVDGCSVDCATHSSKTESKAAMKMTLMVVCC